MQNSAIPWTLTILLALYVLGVEYYAEHTPVADPSIEFYDTTTVTVDLYQTAIDAQEPDAPAPFFSVYGQFNNILEGTRQLVKATPTSKPDRFLIKFLVNSPRPAYLYANDNRLEVFLVPGDSSLKLSIYRQTAYDPIDSVRYLGQTADICNYYRAKAQKFGQSHLRATRHLMATEDFDRTAQLDSMEARVRAFEQYVYLLDSMAAQELAFLAEQEVFTTLPPWFALFEKNEILYQRAYLKWADAYNLDLPEDALDKVPVNNPGAMFSSYYYLYVNLYLAREGGLPQAEPLNLPYMREHVARANTLLKQGPRDVFLTRVIFQYINQGNRTFAQELFNQYKSSFSKGKYERFLEAQLKSAPNPG